MEMLCFPPLAQQRWRETITSGVSSVVSELMWILIGLGWVGIVSLILLFMGGAKRVSKHSPYEVPEDWTVPEEWKND
jgi:hypothetical protein